MKKTIAVAGISALGLGLALGSASLASATEGPHVYVQDYIAACDQPDRTTQFILDALGAEGPTTYTISDGTPPAVVTVAAHSTDRSPVFSIPASGASYSITASTGQSWSFTAAADCPVVGPVVTDPAPEPSTDPAPEPSTPADPAPTDPAPVDPPVVVDPPVTTPGEKVDATVAWLMPEGSTVEQASYDQTLVGITDGDQLDAVAEALIAEACGIYQVDVYHGYIGDIDAVLADGVLTEGEDSALYVKHRFVEGTHCETTPPVVTPPTTEPPVVTPPTTPETPVTPVDETPVDQTPVTISPVLDAAPTAVVVKAAEVKAPVADGLAYTGSNPLALASGIGIALIIIVGGAAVIMVAKIRRANQIIDESAEI